MRQAVVPLFLMAAAVVQSGCLTTRLVEKAKPRTARYEVAGLTRAELIGDRAILQIQVLFEGRGRAGVLEIPLDDRAWPINAAPVPGHFTPESARGLRFTQPPLATSLQRPQSEPAKDIPIVERTVRSLEHVAESVAAGLPQGTIVHFRISRPRSRGWLDSSVFVLNLWHKRPPLTLVQVTHACHSWAWVLLTPLSIPADIVTFPLQFLDGMLFGHPPGMSWEGQRTVPEPCPIPKVSQRSSPALSRG